MAVENPLLLSLLWRKRNHYSILNIDARVNIRRQRLTSYKKMLKAKEKEALLLRNSNLAKQTDVVRWHLRELRQPSCRAHQLGSNGGSQDDRDVWGDESHSRLDVPEMYKSSVK